MTTVLHVTRDFPPRCNGGISTAVGGMVRASVASGIPCAVISFDGYRPKASATSGAPLPVPADHDGVPVLRIAAPSQLDAARAFGRDVAPTHIQVHHGMLWELAAEVRAATGARAVAHVHIAQAEQNRLRGIEHETMSLAAQRRAVAEADAVIAPSRACASAIGLDGDARLHVVGLGVDDSPAVDAAARAERAAGAPILYAGRFADINGIAELFEAILAIAARVPTAQFVVAGGMPDNRTSERRWRERWDRDAPGDVRDRTAFTGWLPAEELAEYYGRASLLISPSWFETFGLVVLEAMHHGLPIAATRAGGVAELIDHERTGLLSPPRDVPALVDNAVALVTDPTRASRLGAAAAATVRARHLWRHIIPRMVEVYA